jgi:hypothetical protein
MKDWYLCDVCGKTPCSLSCDHCHARYCSESCQKKDGTERKDIGDVFPLGSHSDFCPKLFDEETPKIRSLFEVDPVSFKFDGLTWHALPGPIPGDLPHALAKKGDPHYKNLLSCWLKSLIKTGGKKSASYFISDEDATRVLVFRFSQTQNSKLLELWESK